MDNAKDSGGEATGGDPNPNPPAAGEADLTSVSPAPRQPPRTPFTSLSQVDADLARAIQEQERAFKMLRMSGGEGSGYASTETGSYVEEYGLDGADPDYVAEDVEGTNRTLDQAEFNIYEDYASALLVPEGRELADRLMALTDRAEFGTYEAYARALQGPEVRELADRLMALIGLNGWRAEDHGDYIGNDQDAWEDVDPDELSYEELVALGEIVGTESRGLSADTIASLPSVNYKAQSVQDGNIDQCVICRLDYEDGESLVALQCKHTYHPECINKWLQIKKVCPICSAEVSTSENTVN